MSRWIVWFIMAWCAVDLHLRLELKIINHDKRNLWSQRERITVESRFWSNKTNISAVPVPTSSTDLTTKTLGNTPAIWTRRFELFEQSLWRSQAAKRWIGSHGVWLDDPLRGDLSFCASMSCNGSAQLLQLVNCFRLFSIVLFIFWLSRCGGGFQSDSTLLNFLHAWGWLSLWLGNLRLLKGNTADLYKITYENVRGTRRENRKREK